MTTQLESPTAGLAPEQVADVILDELREIPRGGYPMVLRPIVVPRESYRELLDAAAALLDLLRRTVLGLGTDRDSRMAALRIDPADCPMFIDDEDFELRHCADMARADVLLSPDGPKFLEFNVSGSFGGLVHFEQYQRAWRRIRELAGLPSFVAVDPSALEARLIARTCAELGQPPSAVLVGTARDWGPDATSRCYEVQADHLRQHGVHAVHAEFDDLADVLGAAPGPAVGIAAFTVQDAREVGYDLGPVRSAVDAGLKLIPSQTSWLLHTKRALALLSEEPSWLSAREADLVRRYVPWSRVVGDRRVRWRGREVELPRLLVEHQADLVLKGTTGWSCQEVFPGWACSAPEWAAHIDEALSSGDFVVQERVHSRLFPIDVLQENGELTSIRAEAVVSPICIDGSAAGCYVRCVDGEQRPSTIGGEDAMRTCLLSEA